MPSEQPDTHNKVLHPHLAGLPELPDQFNITVPTRKIIEAWRLSAEDTIKAGGVRLGTFNWPLVVLSLIPEWEKNNPQ